MGIANVNSRRASRSWASIRDIARPIKVGVWCGNSIEQGTDVNGKGVNYSWVEDMFLRLGGRATPCFYGASACPINTPSVLRGHAVSGGNIAQFLQGSDDNAAYVFDLDMLAERPDIMVIGGDENALPNTGTDWTSASVSFLAFMRSYRAACGLAANAGSLPILCTPIQTGGKSAASTLLVANAIKDLGAQNGWPVIDRYSLWMANGSYAALASDGTHPNLTGCRYLGQQAANVILSIIGPSRSGLALALQTETSSIPGILHNGYSSIPTGGGYSGGAGTGTSLTSVTDLTYPGQGTVYKATKTSAGAGSTNWFVNWDTIASTPAYSAGDILMFSHWQKLVNLEASNCCWWNRLLFNAGSPMDAAELQYQSMPPENEWQLVSWVFKTPASGTNVQHFTILNNGSNSTAHVPGQTAEVYLAGRRLVNLTALGLHKAWNLN